MTLRAMTDRPIHTGRPLEWIQRNRTSTWRPAQAGLKAQQLLARIASERGAAHQRVEQAVAAVRSKAFHEQCRFCGIYEGRIRFEVRVGASPELVRWEWHATLRRALQAQGIHSGIGGMEFIAAPIGKVP